MTQAPDTRCGFVALLGAPNAGKSTLVNRLVGGKVSIVTHKAQTTRSLVRGILVQGTSQVILVDTPGIFRPKRRLDRAMVEAAWSAVGDADATLVLHDARKSARDESLTDLITKLRKVAGDKPKKPVYLLLNKVDQVTKEKLLALAAGVAALFPFDQVFMISALTGDGVEALLAQLAKAMPKGPFLYPEDMMSDIPARLTAAECVREKLFTQLHDELPYNLTVECELWSEHDDGSAKIDLTIYVTNARHKAMCLGKGGERIKAVRVAAQKELQEIFERPVHLFLFVKEREKWLDDPERFSAWGLNFDA